MSKKLNYELALAYPTPKAYIIDVRDFVERSNIHKDKKKSHPCKILLYRDPKIRKVLNL